MEKTLARMKKQKWRFSLFFVLFVFVLILNIVAHLSKQLPNISFRNYLQRYFMSDSKVSQLRDNLSVGLTIQHTTQAYDETQYRSNTNMVWLQCGRQVTLSLCLILTSLYIFLWLFADISESLKWFKSLNSKKCI